MSGTHRWRSQRPLAVLVLAVCLCGCGRDTQSASSASGAGVPEKTIGGRPASEFAIEPDRFFAATDPRTVSRGKATHVFPNDEVFGVFEGGRPRAYPITMMSYYHVANDVVGGVPVAVTY